VAQTVSGRRNPDELLRQVEAEEAHEKRGRLKIFLGYYSGVGKSFRMLDEGRRRHERGEDIVVGASQPKEPPEVEAILKNLEVIPQRVAGGVAVMDDIAAPSGSVPGGWPGIR
jgi:two-component system sensor histidine kinase KdpD